MSPLVEQVAGALIALREAQHRIRQVQKFVSITEAEPMDSMTFDIEKMTRELVHFAKLVQSSPDA